MFDKRKRLIAKWINKLQDDVWIYELDHAYNSIGLAKCDEILQQQREQLSNLSATDEKTSHMRFKTQENINNLEKTREQLKTLIDELNNKCSSTKQKITWLRNESQK